MAVITGFVDRAKGKTVISTQYMSKVGAYYTSAEDGIVATPSGNQANSRLLGQQQSRITTDASPGDSVRLPPAVAGACVGVNVPSWSSALRDSLAIAAEIEMAK